MPEEKQPELDYQPSLDEDIAAAIDSVAGKDFDPAEEDTAEDDVKAALESDTETVEEPEEKEPSEDEESDDDGNDEDSEADSEDEADDTDDEENTEEDLVAAPEHWPQDDRDRFGKLDKDAQQLVLDQNKAFERRHQGHAEQIRESDALREALAPIEQQMQLAGVSRIDGVKQLVAAHQLLTSDADQGLRWLAKSYGGTIRDKSAFLKSLASEMGVELAAGQQAEPEYLDQTAKTEIEALKAEISRFKDTQAQSQQAATEQQVQQASAELAAFRDAKDDAGNLKHPHYERVRLKMGQLYQADPSRSFADLYETAVMDDPELRQQRIDAMVAEKQKANGKVERQKRAKKVARNVKGNRQAKTDYGTMSVEDIVRDAAERAQA